MSSELRVGLVKLDDILFHPHNVRRDLGDLRHLTNSIVRYGIMQPVVVERYGERLRLRAGHRRVAAARLAGLNRIPAVVHSKALQDKDWLIQAVQENVVRQQLSHKERADAVQGLRDLGCTWSGIGEAFGVTAQTAAGWLNPDPPSQPTSAHKARLRAERRATKRLREKYQAEFDRLVEEELSAEPVAAIAR